MSKRTSRSPDDQDDLEAPALRRVARREPPPPVAAAAAAAPPATISDVLMTAGDERLGEQSPAALVTCDTGLAHGLQTDLARQSRPLSPVASQVWTWGENGYGQLGLGDNDDRELPTDVAALHGRHIRAVACGSGHTMVVVDDGELWATGFNKYYQLGLGVYLDKVVFRRVIGLSGKKVVAVACGFDHTLALLDTGELFAWGWNSHGQLGIENIECTVNPMPVTTLGGRRVVAIACGKWQSAAVLETGELFAWGRNDLGQLGLGDNNNRKEPTQATALAGRRVVDVACGDRYTAAVLESGELFTWGGNTLGVLGHGDLTDKNRPQLVDTLRGRPVAAIACGAVHILALLKTGEVFAWGSNTDGQLGIGSHERYPNVTPQPVHFFDNKRVASIQCGGNASGAVLKSGTMFLWGYGVIGGLDTEGDGDRVVAPARVIAHLSEERVLDIALGGHHMVALVE